MTLAQPQQHNIREQQREATRSAILNASLQLFAERGFEGAVIRDIAAAAGVNHAMVKYHFENKENLWKEAVNYLFARCEQETQLSKEELRDLSISGRTRQFIRKYIAYCARHPEHARIMVQSSVRNDDRLRWSVDTHISKLHQSVIGGIIEGQQDGVWPSDISPVYLLYIIVSVSQTIFMLAPELECAHGLEVSSDKSISKYTDAVLSLLLKDK